MTTMTAEDHLNSYRPVVEGVDLNDEQQQSAIPLLIIEGETNVVVGIVGAPPYVALPLMAAPVHEANPQALTLVSEVWSHTYDGETFEELPLEEAILVLHAEKDGTVWAVQQPFARTCDGVHWGEIVPLPDFDGRLRDALLTLLEVKP